MKILPQFTIKNRNKASNKNNNNISLEQFTGVSDIIKHNKKTKTEITELEKLIKEKQKELKIYERNLAILNKQYEQAYEREYQRYSFVNQGKTCSNLPENQMSEELLQLMNDSVAMGVSYRLLQEEILELQIKLKEAKHTRN